MRMTTSNDPNRADDYSGKERRINNHLRGNFETACRITAPFLDAKQGFNGMPLKLSALHALRNLYPELSQQDIAILFSAVQNFHRVHLRK
jgi:hypothetical protein